MKDNGVKFKFEVTPKKLEKLDNGRIKVSFSDGSEDEFDTVLGAIGRLADTHKLGLDALGVDTNKKNRKVLAKHEQSSCPNVYAVGDVMEVSVKVSKIEATSMYRVLTIYHKSMF